MRVVYIYLSLLLLIKGQTLSWESTGTLKLQNQTSPYLTESDISVFESVYCDHFHHSYGYSNFIVPHEVLIQDILNLIIGAPSKTFSYDKSSKKFISKFSNLRISGCSSKSMNKYVKANNYVTKRKRKIFC